MFPRPLFIFHPCRIKPTVFSNNASPKAALLASLTRFTMNQGDVLGFFCFVFFFLPYETLEKFPKQEDRDPPRHVLSFIRKKPWHILPNVTNVFPADSGLCNRFKSTDRQTAELYIADKLEVSRQDEKGKLRKQTVCFLRLEGTEVCLQEKVMFA